MELLVAPLNPPAPSPVALRNVPTLSKRSVGPPRLTKYRSPRTSHNAPARLVTTPLPTSILVVPVHSTVPPFSSVRPVKVNTALLVIVKIAPGAITVRPDPDIAPALHVITLFTLSVPVPVRLPPPRVSESTSVLALTVTVPLLIVAVSPAPGGP